MAFKVRDEYRKCAGETRPDAIEFQLRLAELQVENLRVQVAQLNDLFKDPATSLV